jgi:Protein of unknown function (DUF3106)
VLAPLANDWEHLDAPRRQKWLGIARRYPSMPPAEQQRVQQQMSAWSQLTPAQRQAARERYKALKQMPPEQREAVREKWQEYQQLTPEQRRALATTAPPAPGGTAKSTTLTQPAPR